jgi:nuclear transport factor 2 (NTF2) superfamily protein
MTNRTEEMMATEMLTYSQLGARLSCSPEAARALVRRLRLPRQKANDGKVLVSIDLNEINHKPLRRSPGDHRPITATFQAIEGLQAQMAKLETSVTRNRADFEQERERVDQFIVELLQAKLDAQRAKEAVARLESEKARHSRPWWGRLAGWPRALAPSGVTHEQQTRAISKPASLVGGQILA